MLRTIVRAAGIIIIGGIGATLSASGGAIGIAVANGSFQIDHAPVFGNGTLFEGSVVETARAPSQVQWHGGPRMRLGAESRATVYGTRLVLEQGSGEVDAADAFNVEARSLRISAAAGSLARIKVENNRSVSVASVRGTVQVSNARGLLVARMEAGNSLVFEPQSAGAAAPTRGSGCLLEKAGKFVLAEKTTNIVLELQGRELEKYVGSQVEISGRVEAAAPLSPPATQVIKVAGVKLLNKGGCTAIAKKLGATAVASAAAAGAAGGAGTGAGAGAAAAGVGAATGAATGAGIGIGTVAVIGGVATAATVGGLAAAGSLPGQSDPPPYASR